MATPITKVSIIVSKGSLEGVYPALIMANGARAECIEANCFFTFFGLDVIHVRRYEHRKVATVGNPGLHLATLIGGLPGVSTMVTRMMENKMENSAIPSLPKFLALISDAGCGMNGCRTSCELFGVTKDDLIPEVKDIISVGQFYHLAAGGEIILT